MSDVMQFSGTKKELQVEREHAIFQIMLPTGKVDLPLLRKPLDDTKLLRKHNGNRWKNDMKKFRLYKSMSATISTGGKVDIKINNGHGPYVFGMNG